MKKKGGRKIKIDTLIVSDIHLGVKFSRLEKLVETIESYDFDRLILNGDIFNGLNFKRLNSEHWAVLSLFRHLSKYKEVVWIVGNHDGKASLMSRLLGINVLNEYQWMAGKKKCLAIHGHQFDRFMSEDPILGKLAAAAFIIIKMFEGDNQLLTGWIKRNNKSWLRLSDDVAYKSIRYAKAKGANYVFCGHTHLARTLELYGLKYWNSGCWVEFPSHFITLKGEEVKLVAVK